LVLLIPVLSLIAINEGVFSFNLFAMFFWIQVLFYSAALLGWFLEHRETRVKILFIPYYFFIMNLSVVLGFFRYIKKSQSVNWERAKRASEPAK
jgi:hypothetical protein